SAGRGGGAGSVAGVQGAGDHPAPAEALLRGGGGLPPGSEDRRRGGLVPARRVAEEPEPDGGGGGGLRGGGAPEPVLRARPHAPGGDLLRPRRGRQGPRAVPPGARRRLRGQRRHAGAAPSRRRSVRSAPSTMSEDS